MVNDNANPRIVQWISDEIDSSVLESLREHYRMKALRTKLYIKPTRKSGLRKKFWDHKK